MRPLYGVGISGEPPPGLVVPFAVKGTDIDKDFVVYGEGWTSGGYGGEEGTVGTDNTHVYSDLYASETSPGHLGGFNDAGRNGVRGGNDGGWGTNNAYPGWGFIAQGRDGNNANYVADMIKGTNTYAPGANPYQTVNYVSCHDNYALFDQLNMCTQNNRASEI